MNKAFHLIVLLLLCGLATKEQVILSSNLVNNPSFEEYDTCPDNFNQIYRAIPWSDCDDSNGSSDYYNTCTNFVQLLQFINYQHPRTGNGEAGIYMYGWTGQNLREYISDKLNDSLKKDKNYCCEFYTSLCNTCNGAVENIGMYFSVDTLHISDVTSSLINLQPQIENHNGIIQDTTNWVRISGTYIALGGERNITLGNFRNDSNTNYIVLPYGDVRPYYFIDDVSVCECSFKFNLGNDTTLCIGESLILKPNMPNATYLWQDGSTDSTYTVTQPGTYWVKAYFADYNITTTDTINIMYKNCDTVAPNTVTPGIYIPSAFTPIGGNNSIFNIKTLAEFSAYKMEIYYRWYGMAFVSEDKNKGWDGTYRGKPVPSGVYLYHITATIKDTSEKIEKIGTVTLIR